jgi:hypothetical protein
MTSAWHRGAAAVATLTFDVDAEMPILAEGRHYADHMMTPPRTSRFAVTARPCGERAGRRRTSSPSTG